MTVLETDRLRLSQLSVDDAPFILELLNTPSWLTYIGDRGVRTLDDARNYLLNGPIASYNRFGFGLYLVTLTDTDESIGLCGLLQRETLDDPDIGFAFLPDYMGKGYGFEAASAVMTYARTTLGVGCILAITVMYNEKSINLLKKVGFHFDRLIALAPDSEELMLFVNR